MEIQSKVVKDVDKSLWGVFFTWTVQLLTVPRMSLA